MRNLPVGAAERIYGQTLSDNTIENEVMRRRFSAVFFVMCGVVHGRERSTPGKIASAAHHR
jgi:hypothetical protein